jgi:hypothetical protein
MIKLPIHQWGDSPDNFLYVNPEHVSAFQARDDKSSWLWLMHDETKYDIRLHVDELERRLSIAALPLEIAIDTGMASSEIQLQRMSQTITRLFDFMHRWIPYCFGALLGVIVALTMLAIVVGLK